MAFVVNCSIFTRLQNLADALVDKFVSKGLMKREYDRVKLHATVMNTKQRDSPEEQTPAKKSRSDVPPRFKRRISFDARKLITVSHLVFHDISSISYMYAAFLYHCKVFVPSAKSETSWKSKKQSLVVLAMLEPVLTTSGHEIKLINNQNEASSNENMSDEASGKFWYSSVK